MTSTWQTSRSESPINRDGVESLEYRPIMLSEDTSREEVGSNGEDEDLSKIDKDQQQEIGTPSCQSSSSSVRIVEGLPFECPLLLSDDDSPCNTDGSINSTSTKPAPIEEEERCTSEKFLSDSTLGRCSRCNQSSAAEIETVDIQVPQEGATQAQQETTDDFPLLVDGNHNTEIIVELISDAMEGCYASASSGQSIETVPSCPIEHECCWDTQPINRERANCDVITADVCSPKSSFHPEDEEEEDIVILSIESSKTPNEFPVDAIQEDDSEVLSNNAEYSILLPTLVDEQRENKPKSKDCPFGGSHENTESQTRVSDKPSDQNSRDKFIFDEEEWMATPIVQQPTTVQWDAEEEVLDNEIDSVKTCLFRPVFRPVFTTANKPASHSTNTQFIESLSPLCLSLRQAPRIIEAKGYHSDSQLGEPELGDHTVHTSSSESTTSSAAFVEAMNLRNRQKSNIFKRPDSTPFEDGANDLDAVAKLGEAKQDPSQKPHDILKESLHSDEETLSEMSETSPCSNSNQADDVELEEGSEKRPVSLDKTDNLTTLEVTVNLTPDSGDGHTQENEDRQDFGKRGLEDSNETNKEIITQCDGKDQHIQESNGFEGKHCKQDTGSQKIVSSDFNIPPQVKFGVLQPLSNKPLDVEVDDIDNENSQVTKDHQTQPQMSPRPFDQSGHPKHDNTLTNRASAARSPSKKVERLRRRELYRMTREVTLQKERCERMQQDALRSVDEFNLVRKEVYRLYDRLNNNQTNFRSEQQCSLSSIL
ncbi:uncharacterized protein [Asterias amurensis]|uniref:uncharacterized protein n=1 Tax=Asterias amurensis TaxID=7602 RepID=UPI003AB36071